MHELGRFALEAEPIQWESEVEFSIQSLTAIPSGGGCGHTGVDVAQERESSNPPESVPTSESDGSSTDIVAVEGDQGEEEFPDIVDEENFEIPVFRLGVLRRVFASLDEVDVCVLFKQIGAVTRSVPKFLVGIIKNTLSNVLEEIIRSDDEVNQERVEIVLPCTGHSGEARSRRTSLVERFQCFFLMESGSG